MTQRLLFNITNGLIIGAFYVLMALGLSLILNLSNVINFAHGGFLVIGGYTSDSISPSGRVLGGAFVGPTSPRHHRSCRRARSDPPALRPRPALQPPPDLRSCLHDRGRH